MPSTVLTGTVIATDGSPVVNARIVIKPILKFVSAVGDGGRVPSSMTAHTNDLGHIGTVPPGGAFLNGVSLPVGQYEISVTGLERAFGGKLTVTQAMVDAGSATLGAALEPAPAVLLPELTALRLEALGARDQSVASAQSAADDAAATAADRVQTGLDAAAASADAAAAANSAAAAQAVETLQQEYLVSSASVGRALAAQPDEPNVVLDFARGGYGTGNRGGINSIGTFGDKVTFTRAGTGTYWAADRLLRTAAANVPRISFDRLTGAADGLLIENAATNRLLWSADLTNAVWGGQADFTLAPAASVIEGQVARRLTNLGAGASRSVRHTAGTLTGSPETVSIIIEKDTAPSFLLGLRDVTASVWVHAISVDFDTLGVTVLAGTGQHQVTDLGVGPNGGRLLRVSVTGTGTAGNSRQVFVYPSDTSQNTLASIIHHVQLEDGIGATSPIITGASALSRAADTAQLSGDMASLGIENEFTIFTVGRNPRNSASDGIATLASIGPFDERIVVGARDFAPLDGVYPQFFQNLVGINLQASGGTLAPVSPGERLLSALAGDPSGTSAAVGGAIVWTGTGASRLAPVGPIIIGDFPVGTPRKWGGTIERIVIYPRRLTDAQLQEITA